RRQQVPPRRVRELCQRQGVRPASDDAQGIRQGKPAMEKRLMRNRIAASIPAALAALPKSYLALMGEFPLRPIKNEGEYSRAVRIVHRLALREGKIDAGEDAY